MSGIELNLAPLPLLASAAFYLTSAFISFPTIFFLHLSFRLPTLLSTNKTKTKKTKHFPWFISLFKKFILRSLGNIPLHNSRKRKVTNKSFNRNMADWQISPSTGPILLISRLLNAMFDDFISFDSNDCYNERLILKIYGVDHFTVMPVMWCGDKY